MKKLFSFLMLFLVAFSLMSCKMLTLETDPFDVDMIKTLESKYDVVVEKVYTQTNIDPDYETEHSYKYLTSSKKKQLNAVRYKDPCNLAWLIVSYVKTNEGDRLIFHVQQVNQEKDILEAVIMIDYPYEYTADDMKTYLQNLVLDEPLLIDFDNFNFGFQYKHDPYIRPQITSSSGNRCFTFNVSMGQYEHLNQDFNPAAELDSEFVWVFNAPIIEDDVVNLNHSSKIWFSMGEYINYRIFVKDNVVHITAAGEDLPEAYIYPFKELVIIDN